MDSGTVGTVHNSVVVNTLISPLHRCNDDIFLQYVYVFIGLFSLMSLPGPSESTVHNVELVNLYQGTGINTETVWLVKKKKVWGQCVVMLLLMLANFSFNGG